jgi:GTP cyclohydrolase I
MITKTNGLNGNDRGHNNGINGTGVSLKEIPPEARLVRELRNYYDHDFQVTPAYKISLPDMQNTSDNRGSAVPIQHVGIHNFKIPMRVITRDGGVQQVHCSVTGSVSLDAHKKGINMSRIMRTFYEYDESELTPETLQNVVYSYLENLESSSARIAIAFDFPLLQDSLRSGLSGTSTIPSFWKPRFHPS